MVHTKDNSKGVPTRRQPHAANPAANWEQGGPRRGQAGDQQIEEFTDVYSFLFWLPRQFQAMA
jgi:hypothetical protein